MNTKQVIVIRKDLNMRKGKMIAQGAHASMACIFSCMKQIGFSGALGDGSGHYRLNATAPMVEWINGQFTKVTVYVNSEQELLAIYETAKADGVLCSLILDAGKTEFNGVPTHTAVGIGPDECDKIDAISGKLQLL